MNSGIKIKSSKLEIYFVFMLRNSVTDLIDVNDNTLTGMFLLDSVLAIKPTTLRSLRNTTTGASRFVCVH